MPTEPVLEPKKAQQIVDALEASLAGRATTQHESLSILGRSVKYIPVSDALKLLDRYKAMARREENETKATGNVRMTKLRIR